MATPTTSGNVSRTSGPLRKHRLSATASELLAERNGDLPVWVRSPKTGVERFSSLSRGKLYELAGEGKIKSASLREPGKVRGCRLFLLSSILHYIAANVVTPDSADLANTATPPSTGFKTQTKQAAKPMEAETT